MKYDKALQMWGVSKLAPYANNAGAQVDPATVRVSFDFNEGYACCGGSNPNCYCSFAESPSADVVVSGASSSGQFFSWTTDADSFDFVTMLRELCDVGDGIVND